jgi:sulfur-oxidizing protein SoxX
LEGFFMHLIVSRSIVLAALLVLLAACESGERSPRGFSLPDGDATAGEQAFTQLQCNACHSTPNVEQLPTTDAGAISVALGGEVGSVKTYADLVTSIINPSHRFAPGHPPSMIALGLESRMRNYNAVMSVDQLVNLVTYLQPFYKVRAFEPTMYRGYHPVSGG